MSNKNLVLKETVEAFLAKIIGKDNFAVGGSGIYLYPQKYPSVTYILDRTDKSAISSHTTKYEEIDGKLYIDTDCLYRAFKVLVLTKICTKEDFDKLSD